MRHWCALVENRPKLTKPVNEVGLGFRVILIEILEFLSPVDSPPSLLQSGEKRELLPGSPAGNIPERGL